jgi:hypothetical protein
MSKIQNPRPLHRVFASFGTIAHIRRRLSLFAGLLPLLIALLAPGQASAQSVQLVHQTNTVWSYHTNRTDPGYVPADAWTAPLFDDSTWPTGKGYFGFESASATYNPGTTVVNPCNCFPGTYITPAGGSGGISSYYRTHFNWTNSATSSVLFTFTNWVDDSVVVYLNGTLLFSFNVSPAKTYPLAWNDAGPSGAANPLGEGVGYVTNVLVNNLLAGDNVLAAQLQQEGAGSSDGVFTMALWAAPPTPLVITNQPASRTVPENRNISLTVGVTGTAPQFQWYKGTNAPVALLDATNQAYSITNTAVSDTGDYFVIVSSPLNVVTSRVARLTVVTDANGPVLMSIRTDDTFQTVTLIWDEIMDPNPTIELGNFQIQDSTSNPIAITSLDYQGSNMVLHVAAPLQLDAAYSIEIDFQQDIAGNATLPVGNPQGDQNGIVTNFHTWVIAPGFTRFQAYLSLPANDSISEFVGLPVYPNSPTFGFHTNVLYWPQTAPNVERYAMRFTGLFVAPENGLHKFNVAHDDAMRLRVYPSETPSGTPTELAEPCCNDLAGGLTLDVDLVAGQRYYYELIVRENGGGDYAGMAVTLPSGTVSSPIDSQFLAIAANPTGASVTITQQPADQTFVANPGVSLFANDFNADNGGFTVTTPQAYDGPWMYNLGTGSWQQNGQETESNHPNTSLLDSPPLTITASGEVILSFQHRYSFEQDSTSWDGGQVRVSVNGGPFVAVPPTSFTSNSYNGTVGASTSLLAGQPAFVGNSPGFVFITSVATLGRFNAGDTLRVEFMAASDGNTKGLQTPNWEINAVQLVQGSVQTVTFSVRASGMNESGTNPPQAYQWLRYNGMSFVPIFRATAADYTFAPQPSDDGAQFRAIVLVPGASATSAIATLNGTATGPRLAIRRGANNTIVIAWPASFASHILESAPTVPSATWTIVAHTVAGGENIATISLPATGNAFYRLKAPIP